MGLVEVSATNYIVMVVGECVPMTWEYQQQESERGTEYVPMYRVKGMPIMSKESDTILSINELVGLAQEGREVEVIIDSHVDNGTVILIQEVLNHGRLSVGTYRDVTPEKNEFGEAKYTGVVMGYDNNGFVQIYTLMGASGMPETWHVQSGLMLQDTELAELVETEETQVKLGGAIRFVAKDTDFIQMNTEEGRRLIDKVDVINKYV